MIRKILKFIYDTALSMYMKMFRHYFVVTSTKHFS